jgi:hypothetical protein
MMLSPRRHSTTADLLRLAAVWLVIVLLVQTLATALALGQSSLHRHRAVAPGSASAHHHDSFSLHQHDLLDASLQAADSPEFGGADLVLAAALALMSAAAVHQPRDQRRHVWRPAPRWAALHCFPERWQRPPRAV